MKLSYEQEQFCHGMFTEFKHYNRDRVTSLKESLIEKYNLSREDAEAKVAEFLENNFLTKYWIENLYTLLIKAQDYKKTVKEKGKIINEEFCVKFLDSISTELLNKTERGKTGAFFYEYFLQDLERT